MSRMFDNLRRELRRLEGTHSLEVQIELDDKGYIDRRCPSEDCGTRFKLLFHDWESLIRDEVVFCPLCRFEADSSQWNTPEQSEYHQRLATAYVQKRIGNDLMRDAKGFNARQSHNDFVNVSMSYRPGRSPVAIPASATNIMTQEVECVFCHCRYSSIGTVYFCPACGCNNVIETFPKSVETVRNTLDAIPDIRQLLTDTQGEDSAENIIRQILENSLCKIISTFQKYAETCFTNLPHSNQFNLRQNSFQRLDESNELWKKATSISYTDILDNTEFQKMRIYFQQRHLLEHQDGIVDQQYIYRANDHRFAPGQRLVVSASSVSELASIIEKLSIAISGLQ